MRLVISFIFSSCFLICAFANAACVWSDESVYADFHLSNEQQIADFVDQEREVISVEASGDRSLVNSNCPRMAIEAVQNEGWRVVEVYSKLGAEGGNKYLEMSIRVDTRSFVDRFANLLRQTDDPFLKHFKSIQAKCDLVP